MCERTYIGLHRDYCLIKREDTVIQSIDTLSRVHTGNAVLNSRVFSRTVILSVCAISFFLIFHFHNTDIFTHQKVLILPHLHSDRAKLLESAEGGE